MKRQIPIGRLLLVLTGMVFIFRGCQHSSDPLSPEELSPTPEHGSVAPLSEEEEEGEEFSFGGEEFSNGGEEGETTDPLDTLKLWNDPEYLAAQSDTALGRIIGQLLERHHPDGAFWMLSDGGDNRVIAWGQYSDSTLQRKPEFASRATFPAASIAKVVTAAAALQGKDYTLQSTFPLVGRSTTLYKQQLRAKEGDGTPVTLTQAFARSMNPPMGILGQRIGAPRLRKAAEKFGFELDLPEGLPHRSVYHLPDTGYGLAEVASGFTKTTTLSPLQAAGIAYSVFSGSPWTPAWSPLGAEGSFPTRPLSPRPAPDRRTLSDLRILFEATATHGTSRKALLKTVYPQYRKRVVVGGKTGSLDGRDPWGRYDWFVGYAYDKENPQNGVIITVMQYHRRLRSLPASQVAGVLVNHWAKRNL